MVNTFLQGGGGEARAPAVKTAESSDIERGIPFQLNNDAATFAPRYAPETFRRSKERELDRKQRFCEGENVTDQGAENWNIHVVGRMLTSEMRFFDALSESGEPMLLASPIWSGEVLIETPEVEGPIAWDPRQEQYQWRYTLDVVSTGRDELGKSPQGGVISEGTPDNIPEL